MVSPRGTYLVIADALRKELQAEYSPGVLPSEADLMNRYNVSRTTVRRALGVLAGEGLVASVPGKGWVPGSVDGDSLADRVAAVIDEDNLRPGDAFPSESKLSERLEVSRGTVRSALAHLEGQGVLVAAHGKGRTVKTLPSTPVRTED